MRAIILLLVIIIFIGLNSCGEKNKDVKEVRKSIDIVKNAQGIAKNLESSKNKAEKIRKERKARGDTMAINFHKLQAFLPDEIPGYISKKPEGESVNIMGISYSEASRKYVKESDDGSEESIKISILDYNDAGTLYTAATAMWLTNYSYENENGYGKSFKPGIPDSFGFEEYKSRNKNATVTLAVGYRFILKIEGRNQKDTENIKRMLKYINLEELAKL